MRTADLIKSKFIRGKDLEGKPPLTLTIADVTEELVGRGGRQEIKCVLWFNEDHRGLSINKTRVLILEAAYGPETDLWIGKRVRLYFDATVEMGGRRVGGVGVLTPPGVIYQAQPAAASWGAPAQQAGPPGATPPPQWDGTKWVFPQPPPPPVWNAATGQWDVVNPSTGEIAPAPPKHVPPPTISERVNQGHPPASDGGWGHLAPQALPAGGVPDFDDDIPFS